MAVARNKCYLPTGDTIQDIIDLGKGIYVCTSTTRPSSPVNGDYIHETNTGKLLYWNGSAWIEQGGSGGSGITNPLTADLSTGGYKIKNTGGALTLESATGIFVFTKPA